MSRGESVGQAGCRGDLASTASARGADDVSAASRKDERHRESAARSARRRTRVARAFAAGVVVLLTGAAVSGTASAEEDGPQGDLAFWTQMVTIAQSHVHGLSGSYVPLPTSNPEPKVVRNEAKPTALPSATASAATNAPSTEAGTPSVGGWYAGATGEGVIDGEFASWLGQPVTIVGTWNDTTAEIQRTQPSLTGEFASWSLSLIHI